MTRPATFFERWHLLRLVIVPNIDTYNPQTTQLTTALSRLTGDRLFSLPSR